MTKAASAYNTPVENVLPPKPEVLRHSLTDHVEYRMPVGKHCRGMALQAELSDYYHADEIAVLRVGPRHSAEAQARADEIVSAWDEWIAEVEKVRSSFGVAGRPALS